MTLFAVPFESGHPSGVAAVFKAIDAIDTLLGLRQQSGATVLRDKLDTYEWAVSNGR